MHAIIDLTKQLRIRTRTSFHSGNMGALERPEVENRGVVWPARPPARGKKETPTPRRNHPGAKKYRETERKPGDTRTKTSSLSVVFLGGVPLISPSQPIASLLLLLLLRSLLNPAPPPLHHSRTHHRPTNPLPSIEPSSPQATQRWLASQCVPLPRAHDRHTLTDTTCSNASSPR